MEEGIGREPTAGSAASKGPQLSCLGGLGGLLRVAVACFEDNGAGFAMAFGGRRGVALEIIAATSVCVPKARRGIRRIMIWVEAVAGCLSFASCAGLRGVGEFRVMFFVQIPSLE